MEASENATSSASDADNGAHLDALVVPDLDGDEIDPDAPFNPDDAAALTLPGDEDQLIDKDAFYEVFKTAFAVPGMMLPAFQPLAVQPEEETTARAASDAVHGLLRIYYPAALMPHSETMAHVIAAAPFIVGKVLIVREIIRARRAKPVEQPPVEHAAPPVATESPVDRVWPIKDDEAAAS